MKRKITTFFIVIFLFTLHLAYADTAEMSLKSIKYDVYTIYEDNDWRYTVDYYKGLIRTSKLDNHIEILDKSVDSSLALVRPSDRSKPVWKLGDYLYYSYDGFIVRMTLDGQQKEELAEARARTMCAWENRLYFSNELDRNKIYYLDLADNKLHKVSDVLGVTEVYGIVKKYIYFSCNANHSKDSYNNKYMLYRMDTRGNYVKLLSNTNIKGSFYYKELTDAIFFVDSEGIKQLNLKNLKVYKVRGHDPKLGLFHYYIVCKEGGWLYYVSEQWMIEWPPGAPKHNEYILESLNKASVYGTVNIEIESVRW
jgi:hypothetical protein